MKVKISDTSLQSICDNLHKLLLKFSDRDLIHTNLSTSADSMLIDYFVFGEVVCTVKQRCPFSDKEIIFYGCIEDNVVEDWIYDSFKSHYEYIK